MGPKINENVIVAARDEYISQLKTHLVPLIKDIFVSLYEEASKKVIADNSYDINKQFQLFLKFVPQWNQSVLSEKTNHIIKEIPYIIELITAILASHMQILAVVRLGGSHEQITLDVQPADIMFHKMFENTARIIFNNREVILSFKTHDQLHSSDLIKLVIEKAIDEAIYSFIPVESILKEYLKDVFKEDKIREEVIDEFNHDDDNEKPQYSVEDFDDDEDSKKQNREKLINDIMEQTYNNESSQDLTNQEPISSADPNAPQLLITDKPAEKSTEFSPSGTIDAIPVGPITPTNHFGQSVQTQTTDFFPSFPETTSDIPTFGSEVKIDTNDIPIFPETTNNIPTFPETTTTNDIPTFDFGRPPTPISTTPITTPITPTTPITTEADDFFKMPDNNNQNTDGFF